MPTTYGRQIVKISDVDGEVATVPATNDHNDGTWLDTDIYIGEFFWNSFNQVLQQRSESGIVTIGAGGGSTTFTGLTDTPANYTGSGGKVVKVNSGATALEFADETDETLILTPTKVGTSRDLALTDRNKNLENDADVTFTVPPNSSVAFPIGSQIFFTKKFESLSFLAGTGVTINSVEDLLEIDRINAGASLLKIDTNEWNLIGELK
jgi:hypothetical protein